MAATALLSACNGKGSQPEADLKTDVDTLSYALGISNSPTEEEAKMYLMQAGSDSTYVEAFLKGIKDGLHSSDDKKEIAYQMGMQAGMQMKTRMFTGVEQQVFAGDSTKHLSTNHSRNRTAHPQKRDGPHDRCGQRESVRRSQEAK